MIASSQRQTRSRPTASRYQLWYGRDEPPAEELPLRAGPVSAALIGPDLTRIRLGNLALVDRVYVSVRDRNWDTVLPVISKPTTRCDDGTTIVSFEAENVADDIVVHWRGTITATVDGTLTYTMDGEAGADFEYCRIGFCVLHPASTAAGRRFHADTTEGKVDGLLPELIAPQTVVDGLEVPLFPACTRLAVELDEATVVTEFEGDLFETEDQRNWTDASFKTYCTPIALGYPHRATRGQTFHQVVRLTVEASGPVHAAGRRRRRSIALSVPDGARHPGPRIGVGEPSDSERVLSPTEVRRLRAIGLDHLRTDVHLSAEDWLAHLDRAVREAEAIGSRLEVALFVREETLDRLAQLAPRLAAFPPARILVFHEPTAGTRATPPGWITRVRSSLGAAAAGVSFATGTDGDFAELNRDRPDVADADAVTYAMNPQVHAFDETSLVQTLTAQGTTVTTARMFAAGRAVVVSPVTLRQRFNPVAAPRVLQTGETDTAPAATSSNVDSRQTSLFAAGWLLGSYSALADAGASSVTYFEAAGPRGLMDDASPVGDGAIPPRSVFPVYHALADIAGGATWSCSAVAADQPDTLVGLAMRQPGRIRVLLANMTTAPRTVRLRLPPISHARIRLLDERTAVAAATAPARYRRQAWESISARHLDTLRLLPYSTIRIDARLR